MRLNARALKATFSPCGHRVAAERPDDLVPLTRPGFWSLYLHVHESL